MGWGSAVLVVASFPCILLPLQCAQLPTAQHSQTQPGPSLPPLPFPETILTAFWVSHPGCPSQVPPRSPDCALNWSREVLSQGDTLWSQSQPGQGGIIRAPGSSRGILLSVARHIAHASARWCSPLLLCPPGAHSGPGPCEHPVQPFCSHMAG